MKTTSEPPAQVQSLKRQRGNTLALFVYGPVQTFARAGSASGGRAVRELLCLVLTELQGFELLAGRCAGCRRHHGAALASVGRAAGRVQSMGFLQLQ
ncbi:hypothetical protein [Azohydromonas lata]|uniref:hypothetical protein n=1 Tax=Azohydromonas lata TaxID=45677 RepID=UPI00082E5433|nr:hypothetical protein [Azohydromonas lata]